MVRTFLKVYMELCSFFLFLQEQVKDIIIAVPYSRKAGPVVERVFITHVKGTFFGMSESVEASKRR